jgi:hypothetical protein
MRLRTYQQPYTHNSNHIGLFFPYRGRSYIKKTQHPSSLFTEEGNREWEKNKSPSYEYNNDRHEKLHKKKLLQQKEEFG